MSYSTVSRDAVVGIALLGATFAAGVYVGKRYYLFRKKKAQKIFEAPDDPRRDYVLRLSLREHPAAKKLRQLLSGMTPHDVSSDAAQLMGNLARLIKARNVLDMGSSCGYNPLILALAMPPDGKVTASGEDKETFQHAKEHWKEAGVEHKIDLLLKPAGQTLDDLLSAGAAGQFDLIFIDMTDERDCKARYEKCLRLVRSGGILALDGALAYGAVLGAGRGAAAEPAVHQLNEAILRDARVALSLLPLADGLTLCFKL
ncbi:catechol O-methyltransferase domain-containing protein 1 [Spea bombifrons]|uniref:catechol O-methyltransferase domain-containing protein 1 n=1 Tax=Spea bombifrons TaxID=233779 RepID=UPI00234A7477|nr:catechol O-methyltransferase domain-containing protein 1 [Spea bombifrons]